MNAWKESFQGTWSMFRSSAREITMLDKKMSGFRCMDRHYFCSGTLNAHGSTSIHTINSFLLCNSTRTSNCNCNSSYRNSSGMKLHKLGPFMYTGYKSFLNMSRDHTVNKKTDTGLICHLQKQHFHLYRTYSYSKLHSLIPKTSNNNSIHGITRISPGSSYSSIIRHYTNVRILSNYYLIYLTCNLLHSLKSIHYRNPPQILIERLYQRRKIYTLWQIF